MSAVPDCLVLKYIEIESDIENVNYGRIDNTVYVLFDQRKQTYIIRGKRRSLCSYSYECENAYDVSNFIKYTICSDNIANETIYNYDNFPEDSNEITYDFLEHGNDHYYEIAGYDGNKFNTKKCLKMLRMLRKISNPF